MDSSPKQRGSAAAGFFVVLFLGLLVAGRSRMLRDPGTLWHTTVGERMLQSGEVIRTDPFSFTQEGQAWIAQQWLGECAMALAHRVAGLDGLVLGAVTILAGLFAFLASRFLRRDSRAGGWVPQWPAVGLMLMLVIAASSYHFIPRPHLITLLLMAWTLALLCDVESGRASSRRLLWLPPIFIVWTNIHGGALGGLATVLIVAMAWLLRPKERWRRHDDPPVAASPMLLATALSLSIVALLVNPYGASLPRVWLSLMGSDLLPRIIIEHAPLKPLSSEGLMILMLAIVYFGVLRSARRNGLRVVWFVPMIWLALAFTRVRHGPLFAVTAAVAIADMLPHSTIPAWFARRGSPFFSRTHTAVGSGWRSFAIPAMLVAVAIGLQATGTRIPVLGAGWCRLDPAYWPVEATAALRRHLATAPKDVRVFNEMRFGGYLIRFAPEARVYIDDRCELYRDVGLSRYLEVRRDPPLLEGLSEYEKVSLAMVRTDSRLSRYLSESPRWSTLHRDKTASLFHREK
ncbi:MAG: hypothetical protein ACE5EC_00650 [Phycisphaerae bacterium]